MNMERYTVASSNIASVGYDSASETLEVEFLNGTRYQYYGVSQGLYDKMMQEASKGRFLNRYIRDRYPYSRVA